MFILLDRESVASPFLRLNDAIVQASFKDVNTSCNTALEMALLFKLLSLIRVISEFRVSNQKPLCSKVPKLPLLHYILNCSRHRKREGEWDTPPPITSNKQSGLFIFQVNFHGFTGSESFLQALV